MNAKSVNNTTQIHQSVNNSVLMSVLVLLIEGNQQWGMGEIVLDRYCASVRRASATSAVRLWTRSTLQPPDYVVDTASR